MFSIERVSHITSDSTFSFKKVNLVFFSMNKMLIFVVFDEMKFIYQDDLIRDPP